MVPQSSVACKPSAMLSQLAALLHFPKRVSSLFSHAQSISEIIEVSQAQKGRKKHISVETWCLSIRIERHVQHVFLNHRSFVTLMEKSICHFDQYVSRKNCKGFISLSGLCNSYYTITRQEFRNSNKLEILQKSSNDHFRFFFSLKYATMQHACAQERILYAAKERIICFWNFVIP